MSWTARNLSTLFNTPDERHAFAIGFFEVLCPWPSRYRIAKVQWDELIQEFHYYLAGRGLGFIALLALVYLALKWLL